MNVKSVETSSEILVNVSVNELEIIASAASLDEISIVLNEKVTELEVREEFINIIVD